MKPDISLPKRRRHHREAKGKSLISPPLFLLHNNEGVLHVIPNHWKAVYDFMKVPEQFVLLEGPFQVSALQGGRYAPEDAVMKWHDGGNGVLQVEFQSTDWRYRMTFLVLPGRSVLVCPRKPR